MVRKLTGVLVVLTAFGASGRAEEILKVHEWGTFTSFQDETGRAFSRVNTDDEPVPKFVHELFYEGGFSPTEMPPRQSQGARRAHPMVTMRLETPVTYFHLPPSSPGMTVDVSVEFRGGWLTQFYPRAAAWVDGRPTTDCKDTDLGPGTVGRLSWRGVKLGGDGGGHATRERVWLAPREVRASNVTVHDESERFLFYRGVGHREAPLRVVRRPEADGDRLELHGQGAEIAAPAKFSHLWLVEVAPDGSSAFRTLPEVAIDVRAGRPLAETAATFLPGEFSKENLARLRAAMRAALVREGLFDDEAAALLNTWELSYFLSPGLRLFFLVPRDWTDRVLPLKLSEPAEIARVMVGRIELATPRHRELLRTIARSPVQDLRDVARAMSRLRAGATLDDSESYNALASGRGNPADLRVDVPEGYRAFLALGRFRTALLLDAAWDHPLPRDSTMPEVDALPHFAMEVEFPGLGAANWEREVRQRKESREASEGHRRTGGPSAPSPAP